MALRTRTRSSTASPTRRKRGNAERRSSGCVETGSLIPSPTIVSPLITRACIRHPVSHPPSDLADRAVRAPEDYFLESTKRPHTDAARKAIPKNVRKRTSTR